MPTFVRERFLSFSREFVLGSTRVASNLPRVKWGKSPTYLFHWAFSPRQRPSCRRTLKLMALPPGLRNEFGSEGNEPPANHWSILPFLWSRCVTSESGERGVQ